MTAVAAVPAALFQFALPRGERQGLPRVEKGYFENSDRSWHYPVHFADQAVVTSPGAGFLFTNTAVIK